ncbi:MAG: hypothetical protein ACKVQB_12980 [Bacteroidia bacterium]
MSKKLITIILVAFSLYLVNCKDKGTDDPEPAKTLNKSLMTNKYWKTTTGTPLDHYFRSDGMYTSQDGQIVVGTWKWLNNSDSLEVDMSVTGKVVWHAKYCTETELSMRLSGDTYWYIFTKQ